MRVAYTLFVQHAYKKVFHSRLRESYCRPIVSKHCNLGYHTTDSRQLQLKSAMITRLSNVWVYIRTIQSASSAVAHDADYDDDMLLMLKLLEY